MSSITSLPKFDNTIGAILIGNTIAAALFGVTTVQVHTYFKRAARDPVIFRYTILILWTLDIVEQALFTSTVYHYAVTNFMNPLPLLIASPTIGPTTVISGVNDIICRAIFSYRMWKFGGRWYTLLVIAVLSLLSLAGNTTIAILVHKENDIILFSTRYGWSLYMAFSCGVAADIVIAAALSLSLWQCRTQSPRTNSLIRILMVYTINTGALTSIFATVSLIMFATMPDNFIFISCFFVLPKLLLNSVLATLNARSSLRRTHLEGHEHVSIHLSSLTDTSPHRRTQGFESQNSGRSQGTKVNVEKDVITDLGLEVV